MGLHSSHRLERWLETYKFASHPRHFLARLKKTDRYTDRQIERQTEGEAVSAATYTLRCCYILVCCYPNHQPKHVQFSDTLQKCRLSDNVINNSLQPFA